MSYETEKTPINGETGESRDIPRIIRTVIINFEFLALGVVQSTLGPTLLDLQARVKSSSSEIEFILEAFLTGSLGGAFLDMYLNNKLNRELLMIIYTFLIGVSHFISPWWTLLTPLIVTMTVSGIFIGAVSGGSNIFTILLWGEKSYPFLQGLHSAYAVGALIAPLMIEPFLYDEEYDEEEKALQLSSLNSTITAVQYRIYYPFGIGSVVMWMACAAFLIMYLTRPSDFEQQLEDEPKPEKDLSEKRPSLKPSDKTSSKFQITVIILGMFLSALASALDLTTGTYLTTFAVKCSLKLSKATGALITSAYWGSFTIGRLISVPLAWLMSPLKMLLLNIIMCNVSGVILTAWSDDYEWALWSGSAIMGLGVSSMAPNVLMWMTSFGSQSAIGTSLFVVSASLGALILPLIIGFYIDTVPIVFMYTLLVCTLFSAGGMLMAYVMTDVHERKRDKDVKDYIPIKTDHQSIEQGPPRRESNNGVYRQMRAN